ncbi:MAG TPA: RDD family protein [Candidatus Dormibacteraeota bacterium]
MAVAAAVSAVLSERATHAHQARWPRLGALVLDFIGFSVVLTIVNLVYGNTATGVAWPWLSLLWMAYYIVPESLYGASLGKMLVGVCVVRVDGRPLSLGSILARNVLRFVDVLPVFYLIGGLFTLASDNSQRVGDRWAGTTVVARDKALRPAETRHPPRGANRLLGTALVLALLFTIGFEYFGRPALVLETMYNQHLLMAPDHLTSYQLGAPQWGFGRVTYPLTAYEGGQACSGSISLQWSWPLGWAMSEGTLLCPP